MTIRLKSMTFGRKMAGGMRRVLLTLGALVLFVRDELAMDLRDVLSEGRLFLGIALTTVGTLSFESDKYCDGNAANYYSCTRPNTYYFYPWWATLLIIIGLSFIVLWFLRRKQL